MVGREETVGTGVLLAPFALPGVPPLQGLALPPTVLVMVVGGEGAGRVGWMR